MQFFEWLHTFFGVPSGPTPSPEVQSEPIRFVQCPGCGKDGRFYMGDEMLDQVFYFEDALDAYDLFVSSVNMSEEARKALREAVCNADFLEGYDPAARSPLWVTPGEKRPFLEEDNTY